MKLTAEQLKDAQDALAAENNGRAWQWRNSLGDWRDDAACSVAKCLSAGQLVRPAPAPKTRPWSRPEDVPLNCWIRECDGDRAGLITEVSSDGVMWGRNGGQWDWFANYPGARYSTDRKTWLPCEVTE